LLDRNDLHGPEKKTPSGNCSLVAQRFNHFVNRLASNVAYIATEVEMWIAMEPFAACFNRLVGPLRSGLALALRAAADYPLFCSL